MGLRVVSKGRMSSDDLCSFLTNSEIFRMNSEWFFKEKIFLKESFTLSYEFLRSLEWSVEWFFRGYVWTREEGYHLEPWEWSPSGNHYVFRDSDYKGPNLTCGKAAACSIFFENFSYGNCGILYNNNTNNNRLFILTGAVRFHDIILIDDNTFCRSWIWLYGSLQGSYLSYSSFYHCPVGNGRLSQPYGASGHFLIFVPECYHSTVSRILVCWNASPLQLTCLLILGWCFRWIWWFSIFGWPQTKTMSFPDWQLKLFTFCCLVWRVLLLPRGLEWFKCGADFVRGQMKCMPMGPLRLEGLWLRVAGCVIHPILGEYCCFLHPMRSGCGGMNEPRWKDKQA